MAVNFGAIKTAQATHTLIDPRDIFNALPSKPPEMSFLRGPQDQVLEKSFARRDQRDLVVKLNTGGGKTAVALLIAKSSLAEGKGPVAYLVPDRYLVDQVLTEANRLGIQATGNTDLTYSQGRAILVETFQKLFNGKSVFGVAGSAGRSPSAQRPHTVIVDDAHACTPPANTPPPISPRSSTCPEPRSTAPLTARRRSDNTNPIATGVSTGSNPTGNQQKVRCHEDPCRHSGS